MSDLSDYGYLADLLEEIERDGGGSTCELAERIGWSEGLTRLRLEQLKRDKAVRHNSVLGVWWKA